MLSCELVAARNLVVVVAITKFPMLENLHTIERTIGMLKGRWMFGHRATTP
ncbi:hypothetical protein D4764_10G0004280 [Takifugu flavidus]|uniref:Uncharacterized protein n=1 Tax=Takifugu flavidus TaxID=433684 RepID=A0A5C6PKZ1_9TELE|nr:hypothetical protein D4764_10G0004280 [Takifugu flavidus]